MSAQNNVSSVYLDNVDFFINTSNMVNLSWPDVSEAFAKPLMLNSFPISGYDWTQPYPGKGLVDGHGVRLSITDDFTIDDRRDVENSTTILTSLTFSIPEHMRRNGKALPMDPSWYICRHIFISTNPEAKKSADRGKCGTITQECANDLAADLTWDWGYANDDSMCSQRIGHPIPNNCVGSLGYSIQDILVANSTIVADPVLGPLQTSGKQQQNSWRIGTGYHRPRDPLAFEKAYNRTYLVATVWGFSRGTDPKDQAAFNCHLIQGDNFVYYHVWRDNFIYYHFYRFSFICHPHVYRANLDRAEFANLLLLFKNYT
ncbi:hypothetical protein TrVGV298_000211 [Trichoderma virens]|nr:hypothetical protein TrVGV298_000211 [Trichoderma virens]